MALIRVTNVPTSALADDVITSAKIADGTVVATDLANDSVTSAKIADDAITTAKLADSNVTSSKIADSNVTSSKIADANITTSKLHTQVQGALGMRNLIINGDMKIAQRGTSFPGTTGGIYSLDRILHNLNVGTWTITQDNDVPTGQGFAKSVKMQCTTSASIGAAEVNILEQRFEGQNLTQYIKGTNAVQTTVSFWIKSNKTGTYTTEQYDFNNSRQISRTFTIDSADTWEKKTITFAADTGGNNFTADRYLSLAISIWLGAGSNHTSGTFTDNTWATAVTANRVSSSNVNLADSTSNYVNVTGWQFEIGDTATPFEHRSYGTELALCERYYQRGPQTLLHGRNSTSALIQFNPAVWMRNTPSLVYGTDIYYEPVPWAVGGTIFGVVMNAGHLTERGGDILLTWSSLSSTAPSGSSTFLLGPSYYFNAEL